MTIAVFTLSLLGAMALGMPIAFALIVCGIALMHQLDIFDSQIVAQNIINGADSFPLMAVPFFMLAGEIMNKGGLVRAHRQCGARLRRACPRRPRLCRDPGLLRLVRSVRLGGGGRGGARGPARPDDGRGRPQQSHVGRD